MRVVFILLFFISYSLFSVNLTLKEIVFVDTNSVSLNSLVEENIDSIKNVYFKIEKFPSIIKSETILRELNKNGIYNVNIIGDKTIVNILQKEEKDKEVVDNNYRDSVKFLEEYLSQYLDSRFKLKINIKRVEPEIDLYRIDRDFKWEIEKFEKGLKDILNLKKVFLTIDNKKYSVYPDINIWTNVYISKRQFLKNEILKPDSFVVKYVDISTYKDPENIIFDIEKAENFKFTNNIGAGEVLRWRDLTKLSLVVKDENCKAILKRKNFEITLLCTILNDAYENEKVRIKLKNGKELIGILRNKNGEVYVEL